MKQLFEEFIERPVAAFIASVEILSEGLQGGQTIDGLFSRIIHTISSPAQRMREDQNARAEFDRVRETDSNASDGSGTEPK